MKDFVEVVEEKNYVMSNKLPSYVKIFLDHDQKGYHVHKMKETIKSPESRNGNFNSSGDSGDVDTEMDLTGSPLKFTFYSAKFDESTVVQETEWLLAEENYVGLSQQEASILLSHYFLKSPSSDNKPLWITCNGLDSQKPLLLGGHKMENWLTRTRVQFIELLSRECPELDPANMEKQHALLSTSQSKVNAEVFSKFVIFNSGSILGKIDADTSIVASNIVIEINLSWKSATLDIPLQGVTANLAVQVNIGHHCSEILPLWHHLCRLQQLIIAHSTAEANRMQPVLPFADDTISNISILDQVSKLLHGPSNYKPPWIETQTRENEDGSQLQEVVLQVVKSNSEIQDFTYNLWLVLSGCTDIIELMDSLELIFSEVKNKKVQPHVSSSNRSSIAKVLLKLLKGESSSPKLTGITAIEMLIEIGFEKLIQDYTVIFFKAGLASINEMKTAQPTGESMNPFQRDMTWMMRLHSTLEVMLTAQPHLSLSRSSLYSLTKHVMESCNNHVQGFETIRKDPRMSLTVPVLFEDLKGRLPSFFKTWRLTLETKSPNKKVKSVFLCSSSSIFPPSIHSTGGDDCSFKEPCYFYQMSSWSDRLG